MVEAIIGNGVSHQYDELSTQLSSPTSGTPAERAPARIKVIGVGGGGCNCVRRMMHHNRVPGVSFAMVNTDIKALETTEHDVDIIQIGEKSTRGWGAGGDFKVGARAATESATTLRKSLSNSELVFVTAGMGGGTGTGAAPYVAYLAKEVGAMVVGLVTTPFNFEGSRRHGQALGGVGRLRPYVDSLIVIHNDRLLEFVDHDAGMMDAFRVADEVVTQGIMSVSELINVPGEINVDFADIKSVMRNPGGALMAIGKGFGSSGPVEAARVAIANPLLDLSIKGAKGVLFTLRGGENLTLGGVNAAGELIASSVRKDANIFFGMTVDESLGDETHLTLIATGLEQDITHHKQVSVSQDEGKTRKIKPPSFGGLWGRGKKEPKI